MKGYVIDVNILFSGVLSQKNIYRSLFSHASNTYYMPDFALIELQKYREVILKKSRLNAETLRDFTLFIFSKIVVVPDYLISDTSLEEAERLCKDIDPKDAVYVALTKELDLILLTRDVKLYDGLKAQGFDDVMLFDEFISAMNQSEK